jgi:hypothetical protein
MEFGRFRDYILKWIHFLQRVYDEDVSQERKEEAKEEEPVSYLLRLSLNSLTT